MFYVGRFTTQAYAELAVNGILTRNGVRDTAGRLTALLAAGKVTTHPKPADVLSCTPLTTTTASQALTITGVRLTGATAVYIGDVLATSFVLIGSTTITCVTGAATLNGLRPIKVVVPGNGIPNNQLPFNQLRLPTLTNVTPSTAAIGATLTLTGTYFDHGGMTYAGSVLIGTTPATNVTLVSNTSITVTVPIMAAGNYTVTFTSPAGAPVFTGPIAITLT